MTKKKRKRGERQRDFLKIVGVVIAALSLGVSALTSIRSEQREAERDLQRRFHGIAVQLDEVNRLVQAAPEPPPGSGATDEDMRVRLVP